jgi:hypothetical protein
MSIFSLSAGERFVLSGHRGVSFLNGIVPVSLDPSRYSYAPIDVSKIFLKKPNTAVLDRSRAVNFEYSYYIKPQAAFAYGDGTKQLSGLATSSAPSLPLHKESVVMLYPRLPPHFSLYFTDRQTVHIELRYTAITQGQTHAVILRRKISSGNLEADLLAMRRLSHYLFIRQADIPLDSWQTVKIDLSLRNDQPRF